MKISCREPSCNRKFDSPQAARMHYNRAHNPSFNRKQRRGVMLASQANKTESNDAVSRVGNKKPKIVQEVLSVFRENPTTTMSIAEIVGKLRAKNIPSKSTDHSLGKQVTRVAVLNPKEIVKVARGVYKASEGIASTSDATNGDSTTKRQYRKRRFLRRQVKSTSRLIDHGALSPELENAIRMRQEIKKDEVIKSLLNTLLVAIS